MTVNIHGARVRVVGASGNIGDAVADAFAAAGAQVLCPERVALDITDDASVEAYFAGLNSALRQTGRCADFITKLVMAWGPGRRLS